MKKTDCSFSPLYFAGPLRTAPGHRTGWQRINHLIESLSQGTGDFENRKRLFEDGPEKPWTGVAAEEVGELEQPDLKGFVILQDSLMVDLRNWSPPLSGKAKSSLSHTGTGG